MAKEDRVSGAQKIGALPVPTEIVRAQVRCPSWSISYAAAACSSRHCLPNGNAGCRKSLEAEDVDTEIVRRAALPPTSA